MLAAVPAVIVGLVIRAWVMHTSLLSLNSDEAVTALHGLQVLEGQFRTVVGGNDYGATTESFLIAPVLVVWGGPWAIRILATLVSVGAALALFRLARPVYGRVTALVLALIGWTMSGALVLLWSRLYMGYTTGFIAEVVVLALACHAVRDPGRLARTAVCAGVATGFAIWSHPMFGAVALLALISPSCRYWRRMRAWWLPLAAGGVAGISPWLLFMAQDGWPTPARATVETTYAERLGHFVTGLLPRAFGVRAPDGSWLEPATLSIVVAGGLIMASFGGLILLLTRKGSEAAPIAVAGFLAYPVLALLAPLGFVADARYVLPFLAPLLMGLGAWSLLLSDRFRDSPWLVVWVPIVWAVAFCIPVVHQQVGWQVQDADCDAKAVVAELQARRVHYLVGDYWGTYLADYLADGSLSVKPDDSVRLDDEALRVDAADPTAVAVVSFAGDAPRLLLRRDRYERVRVGAFDLYVPLRSRWPHRT